MAGTKNGYGRLIRFPLPKKDDKPPAKAPCASDEKCKGTKPEPDRLKEERLDERPSVEGLQTQNGIPAISLMRPRIIPRDEALLEMKKILGWEVTDISDRLVLALGIPQDVKFSIIADGFEMYDCDTVRSCQRTEEETIQDVDRWAVVWYFSVFKDELGRMIGRYINKDPDCQIHMLEQPVRDPTARLKRYTLESFAESAMYGGEPD